MTRARGEFQVASWNEEPYEESNDGRKLTRAEVAQTFSGDIDGEGAVQWLMSYRPDGTAHFVGLQRITGSIGDRSGSFVLESTGEFDGKVAAGPWTILDGTGTDGFDGIRGSGTFEAPLGGTPSFELDYDFD